MRLVYRKVLMLIDWVKSDINGDIKDSKRNLLANVNQNSFLKKEYGYKIIKKTNSRGLDDKGTISTTSEDTFTQKKNFYW